MVEFLAAALTFPTLWAVCGYAFLQIAFWGDDNPSHPGKMGVFLVSIGVASLPAAAGSVAIYIFI